MNKKTQVITPAYLVCISLLSLGLISSAFAQNSKSKEVVVATINDKKITLEDFNKKFMEVQNKAVNPPTRAQFLEELVRFELGVLEAQKRGVDKDPIFQERIKQELYKVFLEKELGAKVQSTPEPSEKELEAFYKKNPEVRLSHILIEVRPGASAEQRAEAKKRATEIFEEVKGSKRPFEELVRLYSDEPISKQSGGDIGWQTGQVLMPSIYNSALQMKLNEIRGLIDTQYGFHIIKLTGRRSFENANRKALRTALFDEKRRQIFNDFFDRLKKTYKISTSPSLLE
jgi:parvulin-like peptidyl-prolyl isomerase